MTETKSFVRYESSGRLATVTLNRPEKLNAITRPFHDDLVAAIRRFDADPDAYVLVLRAEGKSFCTGRDIAEQAASNGVSPTEGIDLDPTLTQYGLPRTDKVVVTAGRGYALGAGGYFFLSGDIRIASRTFRFGLREVPTAVLGPYWVGAAEGIPRAAAFRIAMGDDLTVDELRELHMVTEVVNDDDLEAATQRWVEKLLSWPSQHVLATKHLASQLSFQYSPLVRSAEFHVRAQLDELDDTKEAAKAFVERRQPVYRGQ
jgi:2-(1,2-epoxy-1,2-dihydrophenyl)acetyl-CoA isomerase